jgi:hypothetical protein
MTQLTWGMLTQRQKSLRARKAVYLQKGELHIREGPDLNFYLYSFLSMTIYFDYFTLIKFK